MAAQHSNCHDNYHTCCIQLRLDNESLLIKCAWTHRNLINCMRSDLPPPPPPTSVKWSTRSDQVLGEGTFTCRNKPGSDSLFDDQMWDFFVKTTSGNTWINCKWNLRSPNVNVVYRKPAVCLWADGLDLPWWIPCGVRWWNRITIITQQNTKTYLVLNV